MEKNDKIIRQLAEQLYKDRFVYRNINGGIILNDDKTLSIVEGQEIETMPGIIYVYDCKKNVEEIVKEVKEKINKILNENK